VITCEKEVAELPFASLPDLVYSLTYDPEVWNAESPILFERERIGMSGSPTVVFKAGTPEKPTAGEVINARELGTSVVVKTALEKIQAAGVVKITDAQTAVAPVGEGS
jgi:electron transfer flavoprotein beta subunit